MNFDPTIGLGSIITIVLGSIGGVGGYFTLKGLVNATVEGLAKLQARFEAESAKNSNQHEGNLTRMSAIELQIARECVKQDDFRRLDERMTARFEKVEHTINNSATKTVQAVKDAVRDMLPPRGRE